MRPAFVVIIEYIIKRRERRLDRIVEPLGALVLEVSPRGNRQKVRLPVLCMRPIGCPVSLAIADVASNLERGYPAP